MPFLSVLWSILYLFESSVVTSVWWPLIQNATLVCLVINPFLCLGAVWWPLLGGLQYEEATLVFLVINPFICLGAVWWTLFGGLQYGMKLLFDLLSILYLFRSSVVTSIWWPLIQNAILVCLVINPLSVRSSVVTSVCWPPVRKATLVCLVINPFICLRTVWWPLLGGLQYEEATLVCLVINPLSV